MDKNLKYHPSKYLMDYINEAGINKQDLASKLHLSNEELDLFFNQIKEVDEELANKLSSLTGTSKALWLNLQKSYNDSLVTYCQTCNKETHYHIELETKDYNVKGLMINLTLKKPVCNKCNHYVYVKSIEQENDQIAFNKYDELNSKKLYPYNIKFN